jgi:hypothetical protein
MRGWRRRCSADRARIDAAGAAALLRLCGHLTRLQASSLSVSVLAALAARHQHRATCLRRSIAATLRARRGVSRRAASKKKKRQSAMKAWRNGIESAGEASMA